MAIEVPQVVLVSATEPAVAVAVAVVRCVVVDRVEAGGGAVAEVLVADADAGVDAVRGDARARRVGVGVLGVAGGGALVDAVQPSGRRVVLGRVDVDFLFRTTVATDGSAAGRLASDSERPDAEEPLTAEA
ncbi:hypothetical protein ACIRQH_32185 [Streptomyces sp. NPDC102279]|uniref:hypothetical protein n=1 Tax=Streptomyces sp. NPDC102279 TaxID=3366153 RepID=UPI0037F98E48